MPKALDARYQGTVTRNENERPRLGCAPLCVSLHSLEQSLSRDVRIGLGRMPVHNQFVEALMSAQHARAGSNDRDEGLMSFLPALPRRRQSLTQERARRNAHQSENQGDYFHGDSVLQLNVDRGAEKALISPRDLAAQMPSRLNACEDFGSPQHRGRPLRYYAPPAAASRLTSRATSRA